ncbi:hypothetical protein [Salipiger marinus]|uniref:Uncharacterized protein n=1 Tax=Salipiger marinus TaxID=555512 RepID=A0A1G8MRR1_9RHOB|nr:hypothetical protein [Salipiger marinus]SDI70505.1 hypothetical protein SAMN04487993_1008222 [Salipiger marinus]
MKRRQQMRAQRARAGSQGSARSAPFPLPVGGLFVEARNSEVRGSFAAVLENWRSTGLSVETRPQVAYVSGATQVRQRIPFELSASPSYIEVFAEHVEAGGNEIVRALGPDATPAFISGQAIIADGQGAPLRFTGEAFEPSTFTTSDDSDPETFDGVLAHHDRLIFWRRGQSLDFYYGGVGAVMGELARFPLSRLGSVTGTIAEILSLTVDAGHGMNDTLCILTTTGMMVLYEGLDPGDAGDWRQVSRVKAAPPVPGRPLTQVGSDLWMISTSGLVSVTDALRRGVSALVGEVSRPISDAILKHVQKGGEWQLHTAADGSQIIINHSLEGVARQWIYHVESGSWATADYPAACWHNLRGKTEFTHIEDGRLGQLDRAALGSEEITALWHSSWFRLPTAQGLATVTPHILAKGPLTVRLAVLTDHDTTQVDLNEAWQTVTLQPDNPGDGAEVIALNELIAMDAVGSVFQLRMEVTARWAEIVGMDVTLQ